MADREAIGRIVRISRGQIVVDIETEFQTRVFTHAHGIARVGQPGDVLGAAAGSNIIVLLITELAFAEPTTFQKDSFDKDEPPLQQFITRPLGVLSSGEADSSIQFEPGVQQTPFLGSAVFPLTDEEIAATIRPKLTSISLFMGREARDPSRKVTTDFDLLLARHAAVLGSTGQGKTHFVINCLKEILKLEHSRIVVFDINGEYAPAFRHLPYVNLTKFAKTENSDDRIPYVALGMRGLIRLLIPSERAQLPALRLAIESLPNLEFLNGGVRIAGDEAISIFDDCRSATFSEMSTAYESIEKLRNARKGLPRAKSWPNMRALACIAADSVALLPSNRGGFERNAFQYGNVTSLVNRIRNYCSDTRFTRIVNVAPASDGMPLNATSEVKGLLKRIFGDPQGHEAWKLHIVDLSNIAVDHLGYVLGALLEQFADDVFDRGPGKTEPVLLVLEEAHHYLRSVRQEVSEVAPPMAYDRLAKEGRKFGISMLLCTQRPSELSETVLSQCGTLFVFRLTSSKDKAIVNAASEIQEILFQDLSMLQRGELVATGIAFNFPIRVLSTPADPPPHAADYEYAKMWSNRKS